MPGLRQLSDDRGILGADRESHEEGGDGGPGLALVPLHPISDEPAESSDRVTETSTVNILGRGPRKAQTGGSASVVPGREGAAAG
jgi:hypothetical protein